MATKLDKTVTRETAMVQQLRTVLVSLRPKLPGGMPDTDMIEFRLKGTQKRWRCSLDEVFVIVKQKGMASLGTC
jgi:hypothetical protein